MQQRLKLEIESSHVHIEHVVIVLGRCCLERSEGRYARIQESSVEMIRKCFDVVTQRLGGSQISGIRGKDDHTAESLFSGSKSFGIASGDNDLRALVA